MQLTAFSPRVMLVGPRSKRWVCSRHPMIHASVGKYGQALSFSFLEAGNNR